MQKIIISFLATVATTSFALPSIYVKNSNLKKVKPDSSASTLIADTQDLNKVWVLPPNTGQAELKNIVPATSAILCDGAKTLLKNVVELDEKRRRLSIEEGTSAKERKRLNKIVMERRDELASLETVPEIKEMNTLTIEIRKLERKIDNLYEKLQEAETVEEMEAIEKQIDALDSERKVKNTRLFKLQDEYRESYKKLARAQRRLDAAKENLKEADAYLKQIIADIDEITANLLQLYKERATLVAATASVDYESGWGREIDSLQSQYQSLSFTRMPTYNARVHADFISVRDKETYYTMLPPIAAYNVNGKSSLAWGERLGVNDPERLNTAFPETVMADMYLNLVGGCPALKKDFFSDVPMNFKVDKSGVPVFAISTTYEYDNAASFEVKASYNLWKFYEKIVRKTTRGGFFSRRSYVDVLNSNFGDDSLKIEIINEVGMPDKKVEEIRKQVKSELMMRVMNAIAKPKLFSSVKTPTPEVPPVSGAVILAKGLGKVCGLNVYCQVGGWIFRAGDAIFGSTTAQTRFQERWNFTAREHWKSTKLIPRQGITSYRR